MLRELSFIYLLVLLCKQGVTGVTLITCEEDTLNLSCAQGTIKILSANYGRTNSTTCSAGRPAHQLSNVQCFQNTSLNITAAQCDGKQNCSVPASNANFTDPCRGTYKYLNVSYECVLPPQPPPLPSVTGVTLITCEKDTLNLTCAQGTIKILSANYGRTNSTTCSAGRPAHQLSNVQCFQNTSLNITAAQCDGKQNCSVPASNANFTDPCRGTYKYLNVSYECVLPPQPPPLPSFPTTKLLTCESQTARLRCDIGTIKVLSANYGRTNTTTCSARRPDHQLSNVQCFQNTSLNITAKRCDGQQECSVSVSNTVFGDPCFGTYKYLNVSYTCLPETSIICQNESKTIRCDGKRKLYIYFANYGRRDKTTCPSPKANAGSVSSTCTSIQTTNLQYRCNRKRQCHLRVTNSDFVDLFPHIYKYLEVFYFCVKL